MTLTEFLLERRPRLRRCRMMLAGLVCRWRGHRWIQDAPCSRCGLDLYQRDGFML